jgi:hypothetical protein
LRKLSQSEVFPKQEKSQSQQSILLTSGVCQHDTWPGDVSHMDRTDVDVATPEANMCQSVLSFSEADVAGDSTVRMLMWQAQVVTHGRVKMIARSDMEVYSRDMAYRW